MSKMILAVAALIAALSLAWLVFTAVHRNAIHVTIVTQKIPVP
jgi:hypothetical protein